MLAIPYRAELRSRAVDVGAGILFAFALSIALVAAVGRLQDLDLQWSDGVVLPLAVLVAAACYAGRRRRLRERLARPGALDENAERVAPARTPWRTMAVRGLIGGLVLACIALVLDLEIDDLAVVLAVALGGVVGDDAAGAMAVGRYERDRGGTVYRLEDPPGTDAGLGWLPAGGQ